MGVQGNYPGSGAYTKHHNQATGKDVSGGHNMDTHLHEDGETGVVGAVNMEPVTNTVSGVRATNQE